MKRLALLMTLFGLSAACFAQEPAFCKSMCASEKTQCLAKAEDREKKDALLADQTPDKNPFARTAQIQMRSNDNGSLERNGGDYRRMTRARSCDTAFQRCTRACTVPDKDAVGAVVSRHAKTGS